MANASIRLRGLLPLVDRYDTFLLDQWGVLHDGVVPFEEALKAVDFLKGHGKQMIILSNSAKKSDMCKKALDKMGFGLFDGYVTAGECAWQKFAKDGPALPGVDEKGKPYNCTVFEWKNNTEFLTGLDNFRSTKVEKADFLLALGLDLIDEGNPDCQPVDSLEDLKPLLAKAALRDLPMICCNPDRVVLRRDGTLRQVTGAVADLYETEFGGEVKYYGKPYTEIYDFAIALSKTTEKRRIVAVGDSLHHDILGGFQAGIDTVLIETGIHSSELDTLHPELLEEADIDALPSAKPDLLEQLFEQHTPDRLDDVLIPTYTLPYFAIEIPDSDEQNGGEGRGLP